MVEDVRGRLGESLFVGATDHFTESAKFMGKVLTQIGFMEIITRLYR
jgi:hypothetical protein